MALQLDIKQAILFPKSARPSSEVLSLIEITSMCELFQTLPSPGGLLDQDAELVSGMQFVLLAKQERNEQEAEKTRRKSGARHPRT